MKQILDEIPPFSLKLPTINVGDLGECWPHLSWPPSLRAPNGERRGSRLAISVKTLAGRNEFVIRVTGAIM